MNSAGQPQVNITEGNGAYKVHMGLITQVGEKYTGTENTIDIGKV